MTDIPIIRPFAADEWRTYRALRLRALEESPDAFGSTLAAEAADADAAWKRRLETGVRSSRDLPLLAEISGEPVGLAWASIEPLAPETASLYQMWVSPSRRRLGAGRMLLEAVIAWVAASDARHLVLSVVHRNAPAVRLYEQRGFEQFGEMEPLRPEAPHLLQSRMRLALADSEG